MRDQHAEVQALAARGLGLRAIARELGVNRKTARRFVQAATSDDAVARAHLPAHRLDRYQPHLHRSWNEGCHDAAVLHAEITALGYRGSLRTVYRYLQPLRAGADPAALPPASLNIREVTSWLLRRTGDLDPRQQQLLADLRSHCAQLDRLADHVTSFAKMMTKRTGEQELAGWLAHAEADNQPELHTFATSIRQDLAAVTAGPTLPYRSRWVMDDSFAQEVEAGAAVHLLAAASSLPDQACVALASRWQRRRRAPTTMASYIAPQAVWDR